MANKHIITDRAEIEKHVHTEVWNKTVSKYSIEDALDSESTKQGLHIYVTLCFDK